MISANRNRALLLAGTLVGLVGIAGCIEELGPPSFQTARVSGSVTEAGRPVTGGWIDIFPVEGTVGSMRSSPIGPDGRFEIDRVPVGTVGIGLTAVPLRSLDVRMFDPLQAPIRRRISGNGPNTLTIDTVEEAYRIRAEAAARRG